MLTSIVTLYVKKCWARLYSCKQFSKKGKGNREWKEADSVGGCLLISKYVLYTY